MFLACSYFFTNLSFFVLIKFAIYKKSVIWLQLKKVKKMYLIVFKCN